MLPTHKVMGAPEWLLLSFPAWAALCPGDTVPGKAPTGLREKAWRIPDLLHRAWGAPGGQQNGWPSLVCARTPDQAPHAGTTLSDPQAQDQVCVLGQARILNPRYWQGGLQGARLAPPSPLPPPFQTLHPSCLSGRWEILQQVSGWGATRVPLMAVAKDFLLRRKRQNDPLKAQSRGGASKFGGAPLFRVLRLLGPPQR